MQDDEFFAQPEVAAFSHYELPAQYPRADEPGRAVPIPTVRDHGDPLSVESLQIRTLNLTEVLVRLAEVRRIVRDPDREPAMRTLMAELRAYVEGIEDILLLAHRRGADRPVNWLAWRSAWKLYERAYTALHRELPTTSRLTPPDEMIA